MNRKIKNSGFAKAVAGFTGITMAVMMLGGAAITPAQASSDTSIASLTAQIATLLATINGLQAQLTTLSGGGAGVAVSCSFTRGLYPEMSGTDVKCLQQYLNASGNTVAASGVGSAGNETEYYGSLTKAAVAMWQAANGVAVGAWAGYFGPASQVVYNALAAATGGGTTGGGNTGGGTTGTGVTVTAATQPANSLAPFNAARVPFTAFTLTNNGASEATVTGVTIERTGLASDVNFSGVALLDGNGNQIGLTKTLNSNHQSTIGGTFTIPAGASKTYTVAGNMAAQTTVKAGEVASFAVVAVNTTATVSGSLPITGAAHTINATLAIGSITNARGPLDPNTTGTYNKEVGTTGYTFSSVKVTAGSAEKVVLHSIRWNQSGSAATGDLTNVTVYVDGTAYTPTVSSDGKYYTADFGNIVISKGSSKEISIKGDIVSGSGRTIAFDLYKTTDLNVSGDTYKYGITPPTTGAGFSSTSPWYNASVVTVSGGSITVSKATSVAAQNIAVNLANQPLGGFDVDVKGESSSVASMVFTIASTTGSGTGLLTDVSLVGPNGTVVAGPVDGVFSSSLIQTVTFTDTVTFPVAKGTYTLKGKVATGIGSNGTYSTSFNPATAWTSITGQTTGNSITASPSGTVTGNTMTVKAAAVTITVSASPSARNVVSGSQQFTFANYQLSTTASGEDVRFNAFPLAYDTTGTATDLTACTLYDGTTALQTGSNTVDPSAVASSTTFTLDAGLTIPKGTVKTLALKCNIASNATTGSTYAWGFDSSSSPSATGVTSGQSATITKNDSVGQHMTAAAGGSYTVTNDSSLLYGMAQAGTSGVTLAKLRFTAGATEAIDLKQIALQLGNTASNSPADLIGEQVTLWNGSTQVGTAAFTANGDNATSTTLSPAPRINAGESVVITVKGDLQNQNINEGTPGAFFTVNYDGQNVGTNGNYSTGVDSQSTISSSTLTDISTNGVRIFRTVPSVAVTSNGGSGSLVAGASLYTFTVTNSGSRDVVFSKFSLSVATSGSASINSFTLYGNGVTFNTSPTTTVASETVLEFRAAAGSQAKIVPAGTTKTYVVKAATVTNPSTTVIDSITLALLADTSYPLFTNNTLMGAVASVEAASVNANNIIWSPFSTTTPVATTATENNLDWTNGYGLPGFPSNTTFSVQTWTSAN